MPPMYKNLDANESAFLARELEYVRSRVYEVRYPDLKARSLVPASPDPAPDGTTVVVYEQDDVYGKAKIIAPGSKGKDLPLVNTKAERFTQNVRECGVAFEYTLSEIRQAAKAGKNLTDKLARQARRASEALLDDILAFGDSKYGLKGFVKHSDVTAADAANPDWSSATDAQILTNLNEPAQVIADATKGVYGQGLTMLLPLKQYNIVSTKQVTNLPETILSFFLRTQNLVTEVIPWYKLKAAGASSKDRMVVYMRDPDVLNAEITREFEMLDAQPEGLSFSVPCTLATAGTIVHQPKAMLYRDLTAL